MKKSGKYLGNKTAVKIIIAIFISIVIILLSFFNFVGFLSAVVGVVLISITLGVNSLVRIDTVHGGIPTRFGKRIRNKDGEVRVLEEGIHLVLPLVDVLDEIFEKKLTTTEVSTKATSRDKLTIKMKGSVQYRPHNLNVYIEMAEKTIEEGMVDTIEDEFGSICGTKDADDFYQNRAKVALLIDCMFRLERAPHHYLNEASEPMLKRIEKEFEKRPVAIAGQVMGIIISQEDVNRHVSRGGDRNKLERIREKLDPNEWILKEEDPKGNGLEKIDLIAFYNDNITRINLLFDLSELVPEERLSPTEKLYGIKVARFRMALVEFSEEVQRAFEEERSAKAQMKAADVRFQMKEKILKGYMAAQLSPEAAVNLVESTTNEKTTRQVISVEGKGGNSDLLSFAHLIGGRGAGTPHSSPGKGDVPRVAKSVMDKIR
jgi:regulator of protease activity HflC (stomatin/prohibitin superfamily)